MSSLKVFFGCSFPLTSQEDGLSIKHSSEMLLWILTHCFRFEDPGGVGSWQVAKTHTCGHLCVGGESLFIQEILHVSEIKNKDDLTPARPWGCC